MCSHAQILVGSGDLNLGPHVYAATAFFFLNVCIAMGRLILRAEWRGVRDMQLRYRVEGLTPPDMKTYLPQRHAHRRLRRRHEPQHLGIVSMTEMASRNNAEGKSSL